MTCRYCTLKGGACRVHAVDPDYLERLLEDVDYGPETPNRGPYPVQAGGRL